MSCKRLQFNSYNSSSINKKKKQKNTTKKVEVTDPWEIILN